MLLLVGYVSYRCDRQYGALKSIQNRLEIEAYDQTMDNSLLLQVSTQAICNMITNHSMAIDVVWQEWMLNGSIWRYGQDGLRDNILNSNNTVISYQKIMTI